MTEQTLEEKIYKEILDNFQNGNKKVVINEKTCPEAVDYLDKNDLEEIIIEQDDDGDIYADITDIEFSSENENDRNTPEYRERVDEKMTALGFDSNIDKFKGLIFHTKTKVP